MTFIEQIDEILRPYEKYRDYEGVGLQTVYLRAKFPEIEQRLLGIITKEAARTAELEAKVKAYEVIIENSNFRAAVRRREK